MENKKSIPIIVLAVFSIAILLAQNNIEKVYAISWTDHSTTDCAEGARYFMPALAIYVCQTGNSAGNNVIVDRVSTSGVVGSSIIFTVPSGFNTTPITGCSSTLCFLIQNQIAADTNDFIIGYNPLTGAVVSNVTVTIGSGGSFTDLDTLATTTPPHINGLIVFGVCDTLSKTIALLHNPTGIIGVIGDCTGTAVTNNAANIKSAVFRDNKIAFTSSLTADAFSIWNQGGGRVCALSSVSIAGADSVIAFNQARNTFWMSSGSGAIEEINFSCTDVGGITSSDHASGATIRGTSMSNVRGELYIVGTTVLSVMDDSDPTKLLFTLPIADAGSGNRAFSIPSEAQASSGNSTNIHNQIGHPHDTISSAPTKLRIFQLEAVAGGSTGSEVCIDSNLNGIIDGGDVCFTDTNGDGVVDAGFLGGLSTFTSNANVTDIGTDWFCAFKLGNACNNPNVKTNGVGIFYLIVMIILSYAILVAIHIQAVKSASNDKVQLTDALNINPLLLLVMLLLDVGFAWYLQFIENTVFYTLIALFGGLAGFGIYRMIKAGVS